MYLRGARLHDLHVDIVRDFGKSFMEMKITELERKLKKLEETNPRLWIDTQKLIREYKNDLLKLAGATVDRSEVTVSGKCVQIYIPGNGRDEPESTDTTAEDTLG